ncbi:hypothetical protein PHLH7_55130 [Pseudomonas sp. Ost2]|uniref:hypothetical protein n=1 Tax=Pseudomonas sp. Ost2 TaxID=2678260 RepID=UPI001BB45600|nr:hypothetical protein [Pseudomonas sp. Ost2]BBP79409.1 hypothetical protein PHLH7_55130 [Pseudomonas sp. Ost2]
MRWNILIKGAWLLIFAGISIVGAYALSKYQGSAWIYLLFTGLSTVVLYFGFGRGVIFFDSFIGVLLWLGFWLKFSVHTAFSQGHFNISVGGFNGSADSLDQVLLVVSCALAAVLFARFIRQRFFFSYPDTLPDISYTGLYVFYRKYRVALLIAFVLMVLAVCISNAWFGIYQRGLVERVKLPFGLNGAYAWLLMFGMASISAVILRFEFELNRERYWVAVVIALSEVAMSNVSLWSRGMILNGSALMYGALVQFRKREPRLRLRLAGFSVVVFGLLFVASVLSVNYFRANTFYAGYTQSQRNGEVIGQTSTLFLDRWVGVEGVMAVVGAPDKGWTLFKEALSEKFEKNANSFYDKNFVVSSYDNSRGDGTHFVSLPGYIAFLFYPGSYLFLFCAVLAFSMVAAFFEYFVYRLGGKNLVLCALIAQVIAFRYTSFGYVPLQSYMLFGSILLNVLILFLLDRFLRLSYKT